MLLSVSIVIYLSLLFTSFISFSYSQANTIDKSCSSDGSTCGLGQACVNQRCECDPANKKYWAGKHGCRVCPPGFIRQPKRCYKYFSTLKNHSEARANCSDQQADLFSWRDNLDESDLLTAATQNWGIFIPARTHQLYAWSGGMVHHGGGSSDEYKITWFDPNGPTIPLPNLNAFNTLTDRYCNRMSINDYIGDPEPTRKTKNGEKENCVSFVFVPRKNSPGQICMADDYCSTKMSYICEYTEASLSGEYETLPPPYTTKTTPSQEYEEKTSDISEGTETPSALGEDSDSGLSSMLIYAGGGIVLLAIVGIVAFIIIRKRKQNNENTNISPTNSVASSAISGPDV